MSIDRSSFRSPEARPALRLLGEMSVDRSPEARPALLLLGDSRSRWMVMHLAPLACDARLVKTFEWSAPRAVNSTRWLDAALDGTLNWRAAAAHA